MLKLCRPFSIGVGALSKDHAFRKCRIEWNQEAANQVDAKFCEEVDRITSRDLMRLPPPFPGVCLKPRSQMLSIKTRFRHDIERDPSAVTGNTSHLVKIGDIVEEWQSRT